MRRTAIARLIHVVAIAVAAAVFLALAVFLVLSVFLAFAAVVALATSDPAPGNPPPRVFASFG
jgi:hypothetical protein